MEHAENLEKAIIRARETAKKKAQEYMTPEHLLLSLLDDEEVASALTGAGADLAKVREELNTFIDVKLAPTVLSSPKEPKPTETFRRILMRAKVSAVEAENFSVSATHVLIATLMDRECAATYILKSQGISAEKLMNLSPDGAKPNKAVTTSNTTAPASGKADESALALYAVDLNLKAKKGKIDALVGRGDEVDRVIQIMSRRKKNNPLLIGDPGTGKTAIAEGLAQRIVRNEVPDELKGHTIYALDLGALVAGTMYRGDFEKRLKNLITEVQANPKAILLVDEIHTLIGAGAAGGSMDASNILKPALADGSIKCIGATTYDEYRKYFEKDAAMARRFQKVDVAEPGIEDSVLMLTGISKQLERHHKVEYTADAIRAAVELSAKYITDRRLPDKAIDVLDEAAASQVLVAPKDRKRVFDKTDIEDVIAKLTNTPKKTISVDETQKMHGLADALKARLFGQDPAVDTLVDAFQIARSGLGDSNKPLGTFLFDGPTGVGKTELIKQFAKELDVELVRFDMSEYMEKHAVSRLIGAPPGYIGFDQGGLLTDAVTKKPHSIILLDEIEKAHPDIFNILLQVMDHGALTDGHGKRADFRNTVIVMTTNVSANSVERESNLSFASAVQASASDSLLSSQASAAVKSKFKPEFINRLDAIVPFSHLTPAGIVCVVDKFLDELKGRLAAKNVVMEHTDAVRDHLATVGYDRAMGARPMARIITSQITQPLSKSVLFGELVKGGTVKVDLDKTTKKITFAFNASAVPANENVPAKEQQQVLCLIGPTI